MEKASKALRRSGVRIRSIGSGYSDLQVRRSFWFFERQQFCYTSYEVCFITPGSKDVQPLIILPQMVISQLKDVRTASKAFSTAQSSAMQVAQLHAVWNTYFSKLFMLFDTGPCQVGVERREQGHSRCCDPGLPHTEVTSTSNYFETKLKNLGKTMLPISLLREMQV